MIHNNSSRCLLGILPFLLFFSGDVKKVLCSQGVESPAARQVALSGRCCLQLQKADVTR